MTGYLVTVLCAALGIFCIAGGAVLLWLHPDGAALTLAAAGGGFFAVAVVRTSRPQL